MKLTKGTSMAVVLIALTAGVLSGCGDPSDANGRGGMSDASGGMNGGAGMRQPNNQISSDDLDPNSKAAMAREWSEQVGDRVFFDNDKSTVRADGRETLTKWVAFLKRHPQEQLIIEGHSDEHGTREYNLALGDRRASSVKDFLQVSGIAAERIKTVSYGKERPAVVGSNEAAYSQNRRAVGILQ